MKANKSFIMDVAGILVGAVASRFVVKALNKAMPNQSPTIKALVPVGAGIFLAMQKNPLIKSAGLGMIGSGGVELANAIIPGIGAPEIPDVFMSAADNMDDTLFLNGPADQSILSEFDNEFMNGPADQSILSGPADQSILSGSPDIMSAEEQMYYRLQG
jgi:hypothetical protein